MISVRFPADAAAAIRRFARQDEVTVSEFLRKLVAAEIANPQRTPPTDYRLYPQTVTCSSSNVEVELVNWHGPATVTGFG